MHQPSPAWAATQRLACVRMADGLFDALVARPQEEALGERVEQAASRAKREVDGRPRDARVLCDLLDAHRLGGLVAQQLVEGVEDALPRLLGGLGTDLLPVVPLAHAANVLLSH
jgi:hypothetical protein